MQSENGVYYFIISGWGSLGDHKDKDLAIGMGVCSETEETVIRNEEVMDTL